MVDVDAEPGRGRGLGLGLLVSEYADRVVSVPVRFSEAVQVVAGLLAGIGVEGVVAAAEQRQVMLMELGPQRFQLESAE